MSIKVLKILSLIATIGGSVLGIATSIIDGKVAEKNDLAKWAEVDSKIDAKIAEAVLKASETKMES